MALALALGGGLASPCVAGRIVVANDVWPLSDTGFNQAPVDTPLYALNVAEFFTGGGTGSFLVFANTFGLTESQLSNTMTSAGHSWTIDPSVTFDVPTLLAFDGVFLGGLLADNGVLIDYVQAGGNVYLAAGTAALGSAADEAAAWNTFLNTFGLEYEPVFNGISGNIAISSPHPIFDGVGELYQDNGNSITDLEPANPANQILVELGGEGLYAVFVPTPSTLPVLLAGACLFGKRGRRRPTP